MKCAVMCDEEQGSSVLVRCSAADEQIIIINKFISTNFSLPARTRARAHARSWCFLAYSVEYVNQNPVCSDRKPGASEFAYPLLK